MGQKNVSKGSRLRLSDKYDRQSFVGIVGLILSSPSAAFYKYFQAMDSKMLALVLTGVFLLLFLWDLDCLYSRMVILEVFL